MDLASVDRVLVRLEEAGIDIDEDAPKQGYDGRHDLDGGRTRRQVGSENLDSLGSYFRQVSRYPLLSVADERRLAAVIAMGEQAQQGLSDEHRSPQEYVRLTNTAHAGREARHQFACANLRLVISIARLPRYTSSGLDLADLIQEGNTGLIHAVTKFDGTLGYKFSTYATWWIKQALLRGIADKGRAIRIPVHMHEQLARLRHERHRLEQVLDRNPTVEELAERLDKAPAQVAAMLDYLLPVLSLDAPVGEDADTALVDLLAQEEDHDGRYDPVELTLAADRQSQVLAALRRTLSDRDFKIMIRRYGLDHEGEKTLDDIGKEVGVTRERVRQLVAKSLARLSENPLHHHLYEYLFDDLRDEFDMTALFAERSGKTRAQEGSAQ
nr:sigma-70 family RNA polymerase sigma factor [Kineococcus siccus]